MAAPEFGTGDGPNRRGASPRLRQAPRWRLDGRETVRLLRINTSVALTIHQPGQVKEQDMPRRARRSVLVRRNLIAVRRRGGQPHDCTGWRAGLAVRLSGLVPDVAREELLSTRRWAVSPRCGAPCHREVCPGADRRPREGQASAVVSKLFGSCLYLGHGGDSRRSRTLEFWACLFFSRAFTSLDGRRNRSWAKSLLPAPLSLLRSGVVARSVALRLTTSCSGHCLARRSPLVDSSR